MNYKLYIIKYVVGIILFSILIVLSILICERGIGYDVTMEYHVGFSTGLLIGLVWSAVDSVFKTIAEELR